MSISNIFSGCSSLEEANISYLNLENVEDMSNMFNDCSKLKKIYIKLHGTGTVKICQICLKSVLH